MITAFANVTRKIGLTGAKTALGQAILSMLAEHGLPKGCLILTDKTAQPGDEVSYGEDLVLDVFKQEQFLAEEMDILLHAGDKADAAKCAKKMVDKGQYVDLSGVFALDEKTAFMAGALPNAEIKDTMKMASPSVDAAALLSVLMPLQQQVPIKSIQVTYLQSVVHHGRKAQDELFNQTKAMFMNTPSRNQVMHGQIAFNILPATTSLNDDLSTDDERSLQAQLKRSLNNTATISVTKMTAPVFVGDTISVTLTFEKEVGVLEVASWLSGAEMVGVIDTDDQVLPSAHDIQGEDLAFVTRLRSTDMAAKNTFSFVICTDSFHHLARGRVQGFLQQVLSDAV